MGSAVLCDPSATIPYTCRRVLSFPIKNSLPGIPQNRAVFPNVIYAAFKTQIVPVSTESPDQETFRGTFNSFFTSEEMIWSATDY